jgi:hypothetical protein
MVIWGAMLYDACAIQYPMRSPRKRLVRTVELVFFRDPNYGEWGLTHKDTCPKPGQDEGFNAFWDGRGIYHDVWEHAHEHSPYFRGEAAMNIGGEMAAMGAMWYYLETMWVSNRAFNSYHSNSTVTIHGTSDMIQQGVEEGRTEFGSRLICNVPDQKLVEEDYLEGVIDEYMETIGKFVPGRGLHDSEREDHMEACKDFLASCTREKIANLHRWGFREAEKLVPHNMRNQHVLYQFIRYWNDFTKHNNSEETAYDYSGITFKIYHKKNQYGEIEISWRATLNARSNAETNYRNVRDRVIRSEDI